MGDRGTQAHISRHHSEQKAQLYTNRNPRLRKIFPRNKKHCNEWVSTFDSVGIVRWRIFWVRWGYFGSLVALGRNSSGPEQKWGRCKISGFGSLSGFKEAFGPSNLDRKFTLSREKNMPVAWAGLGGSHVRLHVSTTRPKLTTLFLLSTKNIGKNISDFFSSRSADPTIWKRGVGNPSQTPPF